MGETMQPAGPSESFRHLLKRASEARANPSDSGTRHRPTGPKRLIVLGTGKGGCGKSFLAANLVEWFQHHQREYLAVDTDSCNSTLSRFWPDSHFLDLQDLTDLDKLTAIMTQWSLVLLDGVGTLPSRHHQWPEALHRLATTAGYELTVIVNIEEDKESVFQAGELANMLGEKAAWIVARCYKTCPETAIYDASHARQELLRLGAREIACERFPHHLLGLYQMKSRSIGRFAQDESIFLLDRRRLETYQERLFADFDRCADFLLTGHAPGSDAPAPEPSDARPAHAPRIPPAEV